MLARLDYKRQVTRYQMKNRPDKLCHQDSKLFRPSRRGGTAYCKLSFGSNHHSFLKANQSPLFTEKALLSKTCIYFWKTILRVRLTSTESKSIANIHSSKSRLFGFRVFFCWISVIFITFALVRNVDVFKCGQKTKRSRLCFSDSHWFWFLFLSSFLSLIHQISKVVYV